MEEAVKAVPPAISVGTTSNRIDNKANVATEGATIIELYSKNTAQETKSGTKKNRPVFFFVKRAFDLITSVVAMVALLPIFLVIAVLVKMEDGGPVFYKHYRVGKNGKTIGIYKFRSMKVNAERLEDTLTKEQIEQFYKEFKIDNDPRVTKIGRILRMTSLDELPQLLNIAKGELSAIGPRPVTQPELEKYTAAQREELLSMTPGLSGYWQAYARNNATYESGERQRMELYYVENASIWLDIKIIFKTVVSVIKREGVIS